MGVDFFDDLELVGVHLCFVVDVAGGSAPDERDQAAVEGDQSATGELGLS